MSIEGHEQFLLRLINNSLITNMNAKYSPADQEGAELLTLIATSHGGAILRLWIQIFVAKHYIKASETCDRCNTTDGHQVPPVKEHQLISSNNMKIITKHTRRCC